jgi:hypothetical protein
MNPLSLSSTAIRGEPSLVALEAAAASVARVPSFIAPQSTERAGTMLQLNLPVTGSSRA